ncbi:hypothetical protein DL765_008315 [Monosporascus sp. GIB2]|nr:hypothetical protein DL765_008315 [Monosporascus sp. GIB2]
MADPEERKADQAYQKQYQRQTLKFRYYRDRAEDRDLDEALLKQPRRQRVKHRRGPIAGKRDGWDPEKWQRDPDSIDLDSINRGDEIPDDNVVARDAWRLLGETKRWFGGPPKFDYQKCLGYGGMGLALHYKYSNPRVGGSSEDGDCVLKVSLEGETDKNIRDEIRATKKLARAYHSVQMIEPPSVGRPARVLPHEELPSDDSSVPAESSADEAECKEPPERRRRKDMTPHERADKLSTHRVRQRRQKLAIEARETRLKAEAAARERKRSLRTRGKGKEPARPRDGDADADAGTEDHDYIIPSPVLKSEQQHNQSKIADTHPPFCNAQWPSCSWRSSGQAIALLSGRGAEGEVPNHGSVLVLLLFLLRITIVPSLTMFFVISDSRL